MLSAWEMNCALKKVSFNYCIIFLYVFFLKLLKIILIHVLAYLSHKYLPGMALEPGKIKFFSLKPIEFFFKF